jgi:hypothetical protein
MTVINDELFGELTLAATVPDFEHLKGDIDMFLRLAPHVRHVTLMPSQYYVGLQYEAFRLLTIQLYNDDYLFEARQESSLDLREMLRTMSPESPVDPTGNERRTKRMHRKYQQRAQQDKKMLADGQLTKLWSQVFSCMPKSISLELCSFVDDHPLLRVLFASISTYHAEHRLAIRHAARSTNVRFLEEVLEVLASAKPTIRSLKIDCELLLVSDATRLSLKGPQFTSLRRIDFCAPILDGKSAPSFMAMHLFYVYYAAQFMIPCNESLLTHPCTR